MTEKKKKPEKPAKQEKQPTQEKAASKKKREKEASPETDFPVVTVGASAGGLHAIEAFLRNLPENPGVAVVILQHQDPTRESIMASLLESYTSLPVVKIEDGMAAEPDRVYVRPPQKKLGFREGRFVFDGDGAPPMKLIDNFLYALAEDRGENAICVILSGAGADGSQGARAVNAAGGLVMVQDEEEAEYRGMPHSAVETGLADFILPAAGIGDKLVDFLRQSRKVRRAELEGHARARIDKAEEQVLHVVQSVTGHDFTRYKKSTIERRIRRRMALHQCEQMSDYLTLLKKEPPPLCQHSCRLSLTQLDWG